MARLVGRDFYATFKGISMVAIPFRTFDDGLEEEMAEGSGGSDAIRNYVKTLDKIEPSFEWVYDNGTAGTALAAVLEPGQEGTLLWGPRGSAAGLPKWGVTCRVVKATPDITYDDVQIDKVKFVVTSGSYVFDGRTAVWP
jgi:hypothetical protein